MNIGVLWEIHARSLVPLVSARDFGMTPHLLRGKNPPSRSSARDYASTRMRHPEARDCASTRMRHPEARRFFQPSAGSRVEHICTLRDAWSVTNEHQGLWEIHARSLVPLVSARDFGMTHTYWEERMRHLEARLVTLLPPECVIPKLGVFSSRARGLARSIFAHRSMSCL